MANAFRILQTLGVLEHLWDHVRVALSNGIKDALVRG
jgi:hypothetical protein